MRTPFLVPISLVLGVAAAGCSPNAGGPVTNLDGVVYIGSGDGNIYAFGL